jgi:hypothetical protein
MNPIKLVLIFLAPLVFLITIVIGLLRLQKFDKKHRHEIQHLQHIRPIDMTMAELDQIRKYNNKKIRALIFPLVVGFVAFMALIMIGVFF